MGGIKYTPTVGERGWRRYQQGGQMVRVVGDETETQQRPPRRQALMRRTTGGGPTVLDLKGSRRRWGVVHLSQERGRATPPKCRVPARDAQVPSLQALVPRTSARGWEMRCDLQAPLSTVYS